MKRYVNSNFNRMWKMLIYMQKCKACMKRDPQELREDF